MSHRRAKADRMALVPRENLDSLGSDVRVSRGNFLRVTHGFKTRMIRQYVAPWPLQQLYGPLRAAVTHSVLIDCPRKALKQIKRKRKQHAQGT